MSEAELRRRIVSFATSRHLRAPLLERWSGAAPADAAALLELAESLRLGENQLRDVFDWSEEIAVRDGTSIAAVLDGAEIRGVRKRGIGRNETIHALRAALRRLRFPQLTALEDRLNECIGALDLPRSVRLVLPEQLQGTEIRVEIRAGSAADLGEALERLAAAAASPQMAELFALLCVAP